ncbi:winged helix-turn-helix transcriptional regulator [Fusibacter paucivorans]|uniref:Winged helix-turn-helix transcriptional regulator n=1 Tax=Fusibacter paucivorans TaxID=76009 RepID=A0ABS5PT87_9FIRM|nr:metalloregulator ArsR/SmtB family transcription factor [Fusibacter paucivorans]MBS7528384.1 winged helix-turn-helix transcriptional regulator [Fusibacter paucivorans]
MHKLIERFKALGDETRFKIFLLLAENQICVRGLANKLGISESAVSQHLKVLREAGLIVGEKVGYFTHYKVQKGVLKELEGVIGELAKDTINLQTVKEELHVVDFDCTKVCENQSERCGEV